MKFPPILVYRFKDAPKKLQRLSLRAGDADWVAVIPRCYFPDLAFQEGQRVQYGELENLPIDLRLLSANSTQIHQQGRNYVLIGTA